MAISEENTDIIHYLLKIIARYEGFMKTARNYGTDVPIHYSEIHTVSAIAKTPASILAALLSISAILGGQYQRLLENWRKKVWLLNRPIRKTYLV
jgi:hypothetical protein